MRKKLGALLATALVGGTIALGSASPAHARHCDSTIVTTDDPVILYTCRVVDSAPPPGPTVDYYYNWATGIVHTVYCTASPHC